MKAVRSVFDDPVTGLADVDEALVRACAFRHEGVARVPLRRSAALDPKLAERIDGVGRDASVGHFIENRRADTKRAGLWLAYVT